MALSLTTHTETNITGVRTPFYELVSIMREDGGTPGFLQSIKTALCFDLKDQMGIGNIQKREKELLKLAFSGLDEIEGLNILANNVRDRSRVISFYVDDIHYNLL